MVDPASIAAGIFDLIRGSVINSVYVFAIVIVAVFVRRYMAKKFSMNWFKSGILTTYLLVFLLIFVMHLLILFPILSYDVFVPPEFQPTLADNITSLVLQLFNIVFASAVITFLLMPLEFIGLYFYEKILPEKTAFPIRLLLAVFLSTLLASILVIFVFPLVFGINILLAVLNLAVFGIVSLL